MINSIGTLQIVELFMCRKLGIHTSELDRFEIVLSQKRSECESVRLNANWDRSKRV